MSNFFKAVTDAIGLIIFTIKEIFTSLADLIPTNETAIILIILAFITLFLKAHMKK